MITALFAAVKIIGAFIFLVYPSGAVFGHFFFPDEYKEHQLIVAPVAGVVVVVILLALADFFGLAAGKFILPYSVLSFIVFTAMVALKKIELRLNNLSIILLAFVLFAVALIPLMKAGFISIYGLNTDPMIYTYLSDYLTNNVSSKVIPNYLINNRPYYTLLYYALKTGGKIGPMLFLASINKLTATKFSIFNYQVISTLFYLLAIISVYVVSLTTFHFKKRTALLVGFLYGINTLVIHGNNEGFLAQEMSLMLIPFAVAFGITLLNKKNYKDLICYAAFMAALIAIYPEVALIYPIVLPLIFFIVKIIKKENRLKLTALFMISIALITILAFPSILRMVGNVNYHANSPDSEVKTSKRSTAGSIHFYTPQPEVLGIGIHQAGSKRSGYGLPFTIIMWSVFALGSGLILVYIIREKNAILIYGFLVYVALAVLLYLWKFPYGYYKHLVPSVFLFSIALAGSLEYFYLNISKGLAFKSISAILITLIVTTYVSSAIFQILSYPYPWLTKTILDVRPAVQKYVPKNETIGLIPIESYPWVFYLLRDRKRMEGARLKFLYLRKRRKQLSISKTTRYILFEKIPIYSPQQNLRLTKKWGKTLWVNGTFILLKIRP